MEYFLMKHEIGYIFDTMDTMRHGSAESNHWGIIGRHQVHSKRSLGVSFTGECKLIFHEIDYLKTKVDDDLFSFNDKILDSQQIPVELLS